MCTAATYQTKDFYFGRNLDYEFGYGETVTFTPRHYPFQLNGLGVLDQHYAILGMACVQNNYPLYYDAINEKGLCIAGLNFVGNAWYCKDEPGKDNVAQFELIPWLLGRCATVRGCPHPAGPHEPGGYPVLRRAARCQPALDDCRSSSSCITLESTKDGLHVYDNPAGVLTNNPPFPMQLFALNNYMQLSPKATGNHFAPNLPLNAYSRGMGAMGLPGDLSSQSRFVRAAFVRANSRSGESEAESVSQFFHILGSVEQQRGCCELDNGKYEITLYTSCCNADKGIYYYTTYENSQITAVDMHKEDMDGTELVSYPLVKEQQIRWMK